MALTSFVLVCFLLATNVIATEQFECNSESNVRGINWAESISSLNGWNEKVVDAFNRRCDANICFALHGSAVVSTDEFELQKDFVKLLAVVLSSHEGRNGAYFAALQYGMPASLISPISEDVCTFLCNVDNATSKREAQTYIGPGMTACMRQFRRTASKRNRIVLLGDGRSDFDAQEAPFDPVSVAETFRSMDDSSITAVAVGFSDTEMLAAISGSQSQVLELSRWEDIMEVFEDVVNRLCEERAED
eukprot:TRINITY_DN39701_c0_g1_i1.p1 TRINITY_DN39701_c0_g1~~TRINITY_DN39701_c0_g1_i1.p1  ORF type:complete len:247 (-),score=48.23 TRINITY_DN39701_c0_g1_i1:127-867(-)